MCTFVVQIEDIRNSIDKIDENVSEVKKLYSVTLSAPTSDQSKMSSHFHIFFCSKIHFLFFFSILHTHHRCTCVVLPSAFICSGEVVPLGFR